MKTVDFHLKVPTQYMLATSHFFVRPDLEGWLIAPHVKSSYDVGDLYSGWAMQLRLLGFPDWNAETRTLYLQKTPQLDGSEKSFLFVAPSREKELRRIARECWNDETDLWEAAFLEDYPLDWKDLHAETKMLLCKRWNVAYSGEKIPNGPFVNYLDLLTDKNVNADKEKHENDTKF